MANNHFCGVGIAYSAKIGGKCRLLPGKFLMQALTKFGSWYWCRKLKLSWAHWLNLEAGTGVESLS